MPDSMQNEAMERLKQMYSRAHTPESISTNQSSKKESEARSQNERVQPVHIKKEEKKENILDAFMKDKEKSLIMLLIVLLLSEKADTMLILSLMYLIL